MSFAVTVDRQIDWLVELWHISWGIGDTYVSFFKVVEYSCCHLTSKDIHDD